MSDDPKPPRPAFEAFKHRVLANPDARRAYVAARMRTMREDREAARVVELWRQIVPDEAE